MPGASAATGASGLPILFANLDEQAHQCTVIGSDSNYQAVACADLVTSQGVSDYYVHAQVEAYCQTASAAHTVVPCNAIEEATSLQTGDGETSGYLNECAGDCPGGGCTSRHRTGTTASRLTVTWRAPPV
ncbi:MAG TPA: hypothetical protein VGM12_10570 [Trebonia sp.]